MYLVAPRGYEERASVVVAIDEEQARKKAYNHPAVKEVIDGGASWTTLDLTERLRKQGFNIDVSRVGMFH